MKATRQLLGRSSGKLLRLVRRVPEGRVRGGGLRIDRRAAGPAGLLAQLMSTWSREIVDVAECWAATRPDQTRCLGKAIEAVAQIWQRQAIMLAF